MLQAYAQHMACEVVSPEPTAAGPVPPVPKVTLRNPRGSSPEKYDVTGFPLPMVHDSRVSGERWYGSAVLWEEIEHQWWPVPWINGDGGLTGDFLSFREDAGDSVTRRLCVVCGDGLRRSVLVGSFDGERETSGGWCHPKCLALTITICPHFSDDRSGPFGFLWTGEGVGIVEDADLFIAAVREGAVPLDAATIKAMAQVDPWGETDLTGMAPADLAEAVSTHRKK